MNAKNNIAATMARLVKENTVYRETLQRIAERTRMADDPTSTSGWIHALIENTFKGISK